MVTQAEKAAIIAGASEDARQWAIRYCSIQASKAYLEKKRRQRIINRVLAIVLGIMVTVCTGIVIYFNFIY